MPLMPGQKLDHFTVAAKIGEGGMGEVWRARDETLGREVAIKVLPAALADDPSRLARFEREARLLASLSHARIATVHGLHLAAGVRFLVMELVPGEDLQVVLARGPLPLQTALAVARQVAEALEAAHAAGVIHRDLKPANIKVSADGEVKVLDFGLAKALEEPAPESVLSHSPTLTVQGTRAGVILGTAAYMSPEQARGAPADRRADVWAFGLVLYEMLTGRNPFVEETVSDTLAAVLKTDPDLGLLPAGTPAAVRRLLRRCLRKDARQRLHDMADARIELDEAGDAEGMAPHTPERPRPGWPWALAGAAAGLALGAMLWLGGGEETGRIPAPPDPVRRTSIPLLQSASIGYGRGLALSPDGKALVYAGGLGKGQARLYLRWLDSEEFIPLPGTEDGFEPFFSPDGRWVGFFDGDEIKKVALGGGEPVSLGPAHVAESGAWSDDGWIYFTQSESRLARVPDGGGPVEELSAETMARPFALPGGRGILVTHLPEDSPSMSMDAGRIVHRAADGTLTEILKGGYQPALVEPDILVFMRGSDLMAVRLDAATLAVRSEPVPVVRGIWTDSAWGRARYVVSRDGTLAYAAGGDCFRTVPTWLDRQGTAEPLPIPPGLYGSFSLSPDETKLAIQVVGGRDQIHIYDSSRGTFTRLTLEGGNDYPIWSRDGREVFFSSNRDGDRKLFRQAVDGSGQAHRILTDEQAAATGAPMRTPTSVSPDGKYLLFYTWGHPTQSGDIWVAPLDGGDPRPLVATDANEIIAAFSPDGRWIAYLSNSRGDYDVYVRPFPDTERREWQISDGGGFDARWSPTGDELMYRQFETLLAVSYTDDPDFSPGPPRVLLQTDFHDSDSFSFDISLDGQRILVNHPQESLREGWPVSLVTGWSGEVRRLLDDDAANQPAR